MNLAPIVLFVFNRPVHTLRTIESLKENRLAAESELFVFSDGPRSSKDEAGVAAVRQIIDSLDGFKNVTIQKRETNRGLADSVIEGVTDVIRQYGRVIVVEDDLQFSPYFLDYMNEALTRYEADQRIFSIGGYSPPLDIPEDYVEDSYLSYRCCTWGWATWGDRWNRVDWSVRDFKRFCKDKTMIEKFNRGGDDMFHILKQQMAGKISSWGIRWDYAHYQNEAYCFRPKLSIVKNTGNDGTGIHCGATDIFDVSINTTHKFKFSTPGELELSEEINRRFATFYDGKPRSGEASSIVSRPLNRSFLKRVASLGRRWIHR